MCLKGLGAIRRNGLTQEVDMEILTSRRRFAGTHELRVFLLVGLMTWLGAERIAAQCSNYVPYCASSACDSYAGDTWCRRGLSPCWPNHECAQTDIYYFTGETFCIVPYCSGWEAECDGLCD